MLTSYILRLMSTRTLFLDFASGKQLIALVKDDRTIAMQSIDGKSESALIPMIEELVGQPIAKSQLPKAFDRIAAVTGPGGFMSLRVGISLANALSDGLKIPLAGIHLSDLWLARLRPSSPSPFSRWEKGEPKQMGDEKKATNPMILKFARVLRKKSTEAEDVLWQSLRGSQLGFKFRRQHPIQHRILDFYCHASRLGIEIDGSVHDDPDQVVYDRYRMEAIADIGVHIIRFRNEEVLEHLPEVIARIRESLRPPLPSGEGTGVRVAWLHSTKKDFLFIRGFGDLAKEWPEPAFISVETLVSQFTAHSSQLDYVGELIESQQAALPMLKPLTDPRPLEEVLPTIAAALIYEQKQLLPWYGRGA